MARLGSEIPLIARDDELATLRSAFSAASEGRANAVLLCGDAGVGKSRLLAELLDEASAQHATVLTGRCLDLDRSGLPYLPFVEALGRVAGSDLVAARPSLSRLVPGNDVMPVADDDQATEQLRLFDAVHGLLRDLSSLRVVVLVLEDLHWADTSSTDLLRYLLSRLDDQRLLIVATCRTDGLPRSHPLRTALATLPRLAGVQRVELAPFGRAAAEAFVSVLSGGCLQDGEVREIAERAEGNALFCEELTLAHDGGDRVPSNLANLLLARVEKLGTKAQRVVRVASVAGRLVGDSVLREMSGLPEDELDDALLEAVRDNVLVTVGDGYAFRHALLREAVYADLLPGERVRLHAGYARIATTSAELALHHLRSNNLGAALVSSIKAFQDAAGMGAPAEALHHLEQGLRLWDAVPEPENATGTDEFSLLCSASAMAAAAGEAERAAAYARSAVLRADETGVPEPAAEARHALATALIPSRVHGAEISAVVDEAWELLRERQPSVIRAKVLALRARSWTWVGEDRHDISELRGYLELAINDARQVGAASVEVDALVTLAAFAAQDAIELATAAAERAASLGAHEVELRALNNIAVAHLLDGRLREAVGVLDRICRRAEEVGLAWGTSSLSAHVSRILVLFHLGDWASALAAAELSGAPATAAAQVSAASLLVRAARGEYGDIDELAERIAHRGDSAVTGGLAAIAVAEAAQWRGRFQEAAEHANRALTRLGTLTRSAVVDELWAVVTGVSALADLAEQARRRHDHDVVRRVCEEGERLCAKRGGIRSRYPISQVGGSPEVRALTARLEAELSRLRGTDDVARWCRAVERAEDLQYWQAIARWRLAAARLAAGDRAAAGDEIRAVHAIAAELGAHPLADAVAKLARRARITLAGDEDPPSGPEEVLTPRELTVLELVASGLTNRQVGAELYISEKTASVHLSRVMAKLGATSRTEAVSLAYDRGLLS